MSDTERSLPRELLERADEIAATQRGALGWVAEEGVPAARATAALPGTGSGEAMDARCRRPATGRERCNQFNESAHKQNGGPWPPFA